MQHGGEPALRAVVVDGIASVLAEQTGGASEAGAARLRADLPAVAAGGGSQADRWEAGLLALAARSAPGLLKGAIGLLTDALLPAEHDARALRAAEPGTPFAPRALSPPSLHSALKSTRAVGAEATPDRQRTRWRTRT